MCVCVCWGGANKKKDVDLQYTVVSRENVHEMPMGA